MSYVKKLLSTVVYNELEMHKLKIIITNSHSSFVFNFCV